MDTTGIDEKLILEELPDKPIFRTASMVRDTLYFDVKPDWSGYEAEARAICSWSPRGDMWSVSVDGQFLEGYEQGQQVFCRSLEGHTRRMGSSAECWQLHSESARRI